MNNKPYPENLAGMVVVPAQSCDSCALEASDCKKLELSDGATICLRTVPKSLIDGPYLVYSDDSFHPYNSRDAEQRKQLHEACGVKLDRIGLVHHGHAFCVALRDMGRHQLLRDGVRCEAESPFYIDEECEALNAWGCIEQTKRIQALGTDIPLKEGEYLPSLPMLVAMRYWANRGLNEALEFAGGEPLQMGSSRWSCTEYSSHGAWYVYFCTGLVSNTYGKYYGYVARAVAAFPLHPLG